MACSSEVRLRFLALAEAEELRVELLFDLFVLVSGFSGDSDLLWRFEETLLLGCFLFLIEGGEDFISAVLFFVMIVSGILLSEILLLTRFNNTIEISNNRHGKDWMSRACLLLC